MLIHFIPNALYKDPFAMPYPIIKAYFYDKSFAYSTLNLCILRFAKQIPFQMDALYISPFAIP